MKGEQKSDDFCDSEFVALSLPNRLQWSLWLGLLFRNWFVMNSTLRAGVVMALMALMGFALCGVARAADEYAPPIAPSQFLVSDA